MKTVRSTALTAALIIVALVSMAATASAATAETPEWFFSDIVDAAFVAQHVNIPQSEGVMIIDSRPYKAKYAKGHIPTAVSMPDTQFDDMIDQLPKDKDALLVFYCGGPT